MFDRSRRDASVKRAIGHALGFFGANLLIAPPCLLGIAAGHGARLDIALPYALAITALGVITLRAAIRLLHR